MQDRATKIEDLKIDNISMVYSMINFLQSMKYVAIGLLAVSETPL